MKNILLIATLIPFTLAVSCKDDKSRIKEDLNKRFTKYELIEIREDSSNVYSAFQTLRALQMMTSEVNLSIINSLLDIQKDPKSEYQNYLFIDSAYNRLHRRFQSFDDTKYSTPDKCYRVNYLIVGPEIKTPKEEYYHLRKLGNGEYDLIHRPVEWKDFMYEKEYDKLLDKAFEYHQDVYDLEQKFIK